MKRKHTKLTYKLLNLLKHSLKKESNGEYLEDGHRYIYQTYEGLAEKLDCSVITVRRAVKTLQDTEGLIVLKPYGNVGGNRYRFATAEELAAACYCQEREQDNEQKKDQKNDRDALYMQKQTQNQILPETRNSDHSPKISDDDFSGGSSVTESDTENTATEMLRIWNEIVGSKTGSASLMTRKRAQYMIAMFRYKLGALIAAWRSFCERVASNGFLVKMRHLFDWCLDFENYTKIIEGKYDPRDESSVAQPVSPVRNVAAEIAGCAEMSEDEKEVRLSIIGEIGEQTYLSWVHGCKVTVDRASGFVRLFAPLHFIKDRINHEMRRAFERATGFKVHAEYDQSLGFSGGTSC